MNENLKIIELPVRELEEGDVVVNKGREVYTVIEILREPPAGIPGPKPDLLLRVQWADGGYDIRAWDDDNLDNMVDVLRPRQS